MIINVEKKAKFIATYLKEHRRGNKPLSDEELIKDALNIIERFKLQVDLSYNVKKAAHEVVSLRGIRFGKNIDFDTMKNVFVYAVQGALLFHSDRYGRDHDGIEEAKEAVSEVVLTLISHGWLDVDAPGQHSVLSFELDDISKLGNFELFSTNEGTGI